MACHPINIITQERVFNTSYGEKEFHLFLPHPLVRHNLLPCVFHTDLYYEVSCLKRQKFNYFILTIEGTGNRRVTMTTEFLE